eukprot:gene7178-8901_t
MPHGSKQTPRVRCERERNRARLQGQQGPVAVETLRRVRANDDLAKIVHERRDNVSGDVRNLIVVLGDQLNRGSAVFDDVDPQRDVVWLAEVHEESTKVWVSKQRITMFLAAMRHFASELRAEGFTVDYRELDDPANGGTFASELIAAIGTHAPERVVLVEPGEWQVRENLLAAVASTGVPLDERVD